MSVVTDVVTPVMQALLDCAKQNLIDNGRPAGRVLLSSGAEVAWDDCCNGQLWVRTNPITPGVAQGNCGVTALGVTMYVGVLRCAEVLRDDGSAPPAALITAETASEMFDMQILLDAINCCFAANRAGVRVNSWTALGPNSCVGGEWQLTVTLGTGCGCE